MDDEERFFSLRVAFALVLAGVTILLILAILLWSFFSFGQQFLKENQLLFLILPAIIILFFFLGFVWFWVFTRLMTILGADKE